MRYLFAYGEVDEKARKCLIQVAQDDIDVYVKCVLAKKRSMVPCGPSLNLYNQRSRIGFQLLVIVQHPHHSLYQRDHHQHFYCPSCFGFTIPRASAVSFISDHSGRGISTPSAKRPYVMPPSLLMGRRICRSRACQHCQQEDQRE
jgi:hypothetical protein